MQAIVHIGMTKTGSTVLQNSLQGSAEYLATRGLLYPRNPPRCSFNNHRLLATQFMPFDTLPRHMKNRGGYSDASIGGKFDEFVAHVVSQIEAQQPRGLIFSTETLFRPLPAPLHEAIRDTYRRFGATALRFVAYLRKPSEHYLAQVMQVLTASSVVRSPRERSYREPLESYEACFGAGSLSVHLYNRADLQDGDIVGDFCKRHLQAFDVDPRRLSTEGRRNETLSAESMDIVAAYRRAFHAERDNINTKDTVLLRTTLAEAERVYGAPKPRLHPHIAEMVDYATRDVLWVRDRFGVVFPGLDYERLAAAKPAEEAAERIHKLEELVVIDRDVQARVLESLAQSAWAEDPDRGAWLSSLQASDGSREAKAMAPPTANPVPADRHGQSDCAALRGLRATPQ